MLVPNTCIATKEDGSPCLARPMRDGEFCFLHSPDHREEAAEARRLGGLRRRRERIIASVYDFDGLDNVGKIRRLVEIAAEDALGLENSVARARTLGALAQTASRLLETGELEARVAALETLLSPRQNRRGAQ